MRALLTTSVPNRNLLAPDRVARFSTLGGLGGAGVGGGAMLGGLGGFGGGPGLGGFGLAAKSALPFDTKTDYDLIVIGGGTGGISCAQEARALGLKVAIFDYVSPSPHGSTWGLGGTCVNVGCVPKKLMHIAAQNHEHHKASKGFGWTNSDGKEGQTQHDWVTLRNHV